MGRVKPRKVKRIKTLAERRSHEMLLPREYHADRPPPAPPVVTLNDGRVVCVNRATRRAARKRGGM